MAELDLSFRAPRNGQHSSRHRLGLLLVIALIAVLMSPVKKSDIQTANAVSANPTPVCVGAYCTVTFPYTGDYYSWTAPTNGSYDLKVWGAQGGNDGTYPSSYFGGRGGYSAGTVSLTAGTQLHIYVGQQGGRTPSCSSGWTSSGGGGATDIRLVGGAWNNSASLLSRIIVAGGGGGRHGGNYETVGGSGSRAYVGNDGGGATAPSYAVSGYTITGASQTAGGASTYGSSVVVGSFGYASPNANTNSCSYGGWNGGARGSDGWANGGGGGGWYGGTTSWPTGGGGSGYVLTSSSHKPASYSPTSSYWMTSTSSIAGDSTMPNPSSGTMTGRTGNGVATITYLNVPTPTITASVSGTSNQSSSITYTVNYSESVTGIDTSDFQLSGTSTGWSIASLTGSGSGPYTISVTGTSVTSGTLILTQLQNSVYGTSTAQNGPAVNTAASTITIDVDRPTVSITSAPSSPAAGMTQTFGVTYSESVTGIASADFTNTGTAQGCVFTPSASSGTSINVVVTQCQEGTLQLRIAEDSVADGATNTGPVSPVQSALITLQASALTVTAGAKSINYGGSWTDSFTQSGLLGGDSITSASYSYSGTTTLGTSYGPSSTKPTAGGSYTITPTVVLNGSNANRYAISYVTGSLTIARVAQSALSISSTSGTYGSTLSLTTSGGSGVGAVTYAVSSGSCSVSGSTLTLGDAGSSCSVIATKAADDNYTSISSVATSISIAKASQAVVVISTTSATYGEGLILGTTGGTGAGAVTYSVVSGTCTIVGALLTPGNAGSSCVIKATKATDTNYLERSSVDTTVTIAKAAQSALSVTSTSATYGAALSLTSSGGSGAGAVTYSVVSGTCTISGTSLTPGDAGSSCVIKATKATDTNYLERSSVDTTVTIAKAAQSALSVTSTSATYGATLSLTSSGGSGTGAVSFTVVSGSCSITSASLTPGNAGSSCVIKATKATDTNYLERSSVDTTVTIAKATQAVISITTTSATYDQDLVLGITGGSGSGAVSYSVVSGTCSIVGALLTPGNAGSSCVIKATKATDTNYLERSSSNTSITTGKAQQSGLSVTSSASFTTGSSLTLTATGGQSTGSLSWAVNSGICSLSGTTLTASRGGISCVVEVTRAGDSNYFSDSSTQTITVDKIVQVLTFRSTPPSSPVVGGTYTVQVDSDASLAPTVTVSNSSASVCSISAGVVTFNSVGTCVVSASQAGNDVYAAAAASQSISVGVVPTTTVAPASSGNGSTTNSSTTTIPQSAVPAPVSTSSTTTTTTTTTLPADPGSPYMANGEAPALDAGEATAVIRGQKVKVISKAENGQLTMTLPGNVIVRIGSLNSASGEAQVGADGVLRAYGDVGVGVEVNGFVPKTTYTVYMFSDPVELGRGEASSKGTVNQTVVIPKDAEAGEHTLQVNGVGPGDEVISVSMGFEVMERQSNTRIAVIVITLAIALALLGGRPIFKRRRKLA